jgi:hypothetical protein
VPLSGLPGDDERWSVTDEPVLETRRSPFTVMGIVVATAIVITFAAGGAMLLARRAADEAGIARSTATAVPALTRDIALRSAPADDTAIVTRLPVGTRVRVLGRSPDARWLVVGLEGGSSLVGWAPVDAVAGAGDGRRRRPVGDAGHGARGSLDVHARPP